MLSDNHVINSSKDWTSHLAAEKCMLTVRTMQKVQSSVGRATSGLCEAGSGQLAQRSDPPGDSEQDRVVVVLLEVVVP